MNVAFAPIGWSLLLAVLLMAVFWLIQLRTRNAGIVDVVWAFATAAVAVVLAHSVDTGVQWRQWLLSVMMLIWGGRLGTHLARRMLSEAEDGRYRGLKVALGAWAQPAMLGFFLIQALWAVMFALPVWAAAQAPDPAFRILDALGIMIFLVAVLAESVADRQLARFRREPSNVGKVCDTGLWKYSRHPNYFFEWIHWFAYAAIGFGSPFWWITVAGIVVMYLFLVKVTGIPHTERQSLKSRGDAYRRYQQTTSVFFPMPRQSA